MVTLILPGGSQFTAFMVLNSLIMDVGVAVTVHGNY